MALTRFLAYAVLFAGSSFAYPQDAEFIPSTIPRGDSDSGTNDDGIIIVNVRPVTSQFDPLMNLFRRIFKSSPLPFSPSGSRGVPAGVPNFFGGNAPFLPDFPDFLDFPITPELPNIPNVILSRVPNLKDLPDNYDNTTYDVKVVNGTKIETNNTIIKSKDDNGVFVQQVHIIRYTPEKKAENPPTESRNVSRSDDVSPSPEVTINTSENEIETSTSSAYEDFGNKPVNVKRKRRWIPNFLKKIFSSFKTQSKSLEQQSTTPDPTFRSFLRDTRVNYLRHNNTNIEKDAEIFDPEALREDKINSLAENIDNIEREPYHSSPKPISLSYVSSPTSYSNVHRQSIQNREEERDENSLLTNFPYRHSSLSHYKFSAIRYRVPR